MRTFSVKVLQDASSLPWCWEIPMNPENKPIWGVNIIPIPQFESWSSPDDGSIPSPVGEPISYTWSALLDPADTPLPDWITETTPPPAPVPVDDNTTP